MITAYALAWPNGDVLVFRTHDVAEENRKWFAKQADKTDRDGNPRGEPRLVELIEKP